MIPNRFEFNELMASNASNLPLKVQNWIILDKNGWSFYVDESVGESVGVLDGNLKILHVLDSS